MWIHLCYQYDYFIVFNQKGFTFVTPMTKKNIQGKCVSDYVAILSDYVAILGDDVAISYSIRQEKTMIKGAWRGPF